MKTFSALLAICVKKNPGHLCGEFTDHWWISSTKASDAEFGVFFDLRLNKRLSK